MVIFNEGLVKVAEQYLKKGAKIYVEGANQTRKWTDGAGVERFVTEVVLGPFHSQLVMLDRREGGPPPADPATYGAGAGAKPEFDDEIPF